MSVSTPVTSLKDPLLQFLLLQGTSLDPGLNILSSVRRRPLPPPSPDLSGPLLPIWTSPRRSLGRRFNFRQHPGSCSPDLANLSFIVRRPCTKTIRADQVRTGVVSGNHGPTLSAVTWWCLNRSAAPEVPKFSLRKAICTSLHLAPARMQLASSTPLHLPAVSVLYAC